MVEKIEVKISKISEPFVQRMSLDGIEFVDANELFAWEGNEYVCNFSYTINPGENYRFELYLTGIKGSCDCIVKNLTKSIIYLSDSKELDEDFNVNFECDIY